MALNSSKIKGGGGNGPQQPLIEPGVYPARLVQVIDFGLQPQRPFQGKDKPPANEVGFTYELVDCFMVDDKGAEQLDKPRWVSEIMPIYNIEKADKAKCTQRYKAIDPTNAFGGDFSKLVDIPINVALVNNVSGDKTYTNVSSVAAMRPKDADKCAPLVNPVKVFDLDDPNVEVFNAFPDWIKEKIQKNLNYNGSKLQALIDGKPAEAPAPQQAPAPQEDNDDKPWD